MKTRLEEEVEVKGGLSSPQFDFRRGHFTLEAISTIVDPAKTSVRNGLLDVKNAFNME